MKDLSLKLGLIELYQLVGDDHGVVFEYPDLPGVLVTIGFSSQEEEEEEQENESVH